MQLTSVKFWKPLAGPSSTLQGPLSNPCSNPFAFLGAVSRELTPSEKQVHVPGGAAVPGCESVLTGDEDTGV